jgi:hypothetical protein
MTKKYKKKTTYFLVLDVSEQKSWLLQIKHGIYTKEEAEQVFSQIEAELFKELENTQPAPPNMLLEYEIRRKFSSLIKEG